MSTTSKSPRRVLLVAHEAARRAIPAYRYRCSPQKYTQWQLFACIVLKVQLKQDYRGLWQLLNDTPSLCEVIGLKAVPHWTTLQHAAKRLLTDQSVGRLLESTLTFDRPKRRVKHSAADSTGLDTHHVSRYFIWRTHRDKTGKKPKKKVSYRKYGKLMILVCCMSHLILSAVASAGPTPDVDQLEGLMGRLPQQVTIERLLADAGFDSAFNHHLLRDEHGIVSTIPPKIGRPTTDPTQLPTDPYRRLMKTRFNQEAYNHRPQVETVNSMIKRNYGTCLRGRTYQSRRRDMLAMVLTHNIAILFAMFG